MDDYGKKAAVSANVPADGTAGESAGRAEKKLTDSSMLALSPEAESALARDFAALRERLDTVVRSDAAQGLPPAGPIHTERHRVLPPGEAAGQFPPADGEGRGRELLKGAARFDGACAVVPRVV